MHGLKLAADKMPSFRFDGLNKVLNTIKTSNKHLNEDVFRFTTSHLHNAIDKVLGKEKPGSALFDKSIRLKHNTARFAAFKTAHMVHDLTKEPGNASSINTKYNTNYLQAEYVHTIRSARSAKNWEQYQADKDLYPYLEYRPSVSAEPRNEHKKLYGVIKPVDDSFWDTWLPPNDWGCKCSVRQVREVSSFINPPDDIKPPPAAMRTNPGKSSQIFTDKHPMIQRVSKTAKANIDREFKKLYLKHVRKSVYEEAKELVGTKVKVNNKDILISNRGLKKAISQTIKDELLWQMKNYILTHLKEVLSKSKLVKEESPIKSGERVNIQKTLIYEYEQFHLIIWKTKEEYIFHSIKQKSSQK